MKWTCIAAAVLILLLALLGFVISQEGGDGCDAVLIQNIITFGEWNEFDSIFHELVEMSRTELEEASTGVGAKAKFSESFLDFIKFSGSYNSSRFRSLEEKYREERYEEIHQEDRTWFASLIVPEENVRAWLECKLASSKGLQGKVIGEFENDFIVGLTYNRIADESLPKITSINILGAHQIGDGFQVGTEITHALLSSVFTRDTDGQVTISINTTWGSFNKILLPKPEPPKEQITKFRLKGSRLSVFPVIEAWQVRVAGNDTGHENFGCVGPYQDFGYGAPSLVHPGGDHPNPNIDITVNPNGSIQVTRGAKDHFVHARIEVFNQEAKSIPFTRWGGWDTACLHLEDSGGLRRVDNLSSLVFSAGWTTIHLVGYHQHGDFSMGFTSDLKSQVDLMSAERFTVSTPTYLFEIRYEKSGLNALKQVEVCSDVLLECTFDGIYTLDDPIDFDSLSEVKLRVEGVSDPQTFNVDFRDIAIHAFVDIGTILEVPLNEVIAEVGFGSGHYEEIVYKARRIFVSPSPVNFSWVVIGESKSLSLELLNNGDREVTGTINSSNQAVFDLASSSFAVPANSSGSVTITFKPTEADSYAEEIQVTHTANAGPNPITIEVLGVGNQPPAVANPIPDTELMKGESTSWSITDLAVFTDSDSDILTYMVGSSDSSVVAVNMSGNSLQAVAIEEGESIVTITADDSKGGAVSTTFTITVEEIDPPPTPENLTATANSYHFIQLTWGSGSGQALGHYIERKKDGDASFVRIDSTGADSISYRDEIDIGGNTTYIYRVRAFNAGGNSPYSNEASATTHSDLLGDVNNDAQVNITDALIVATYELNFSIAIPNNGAIELGDVNDDDEITITDALIIATYDIAPDNPNLPAGIAQPIPLNNPPAVKPVALLNKVVDGDVTFEVAIEDTYKGIGDVITVTLFARSSNTPEDIGAYSAHIQWNPSELQFVAYHEPAVPTFTHHQVATDAVESGSLRLNGLDVQGVSKEAEIIRLQFFVVGKPRNDTFDIELADLVAAQTFYDLLPIAQVVLPEFIAVPAVFALYQNYPNPFNPQTTIAFDVPRTASVQLDIYNISGQLVRTLIDGEVDTGYHEVVWDGQDEQGHYVSNGLYFVQMTAEDYRLVRKMMMLK